MKKIFAFILAVIMVASLVPTTIFAAITNCPDTHTVNNCKYTTVDTVKPGCESVGYTMYSCDACGEQFLGDFTKALGHNWKSTANKTHENTVGSCVDGTLTKKWEKCSVCGIVGKYGCDDADCDDVECKLGYNEYEVEHNLDYVSGVGCGAVYKCLECKELFNKQGEPAAEDPHEWSETPVILDEPYWSKGVAIDGLAEYKCEECGDVKKVTIRCPHNHKFVKVSAYVAPSCSTPGKWAVYQCRECLQYEYRNKADEVQEAENEVIPALGHELEDGGELIPGKCQMIGDCVREGCKQKNVTVILEEHVDVVEHNARDASCSGIGYKMLACYHCGENWVETIEPKGHDIITVTVAISDCKNKGATLELCSKPNCDSKIQYNNSNYYVYKDVLYTVVKVSNLPLDALTHNVVKQAVSEGSCNADSIYIYYCENGCTSYPTHVEVTKAPGHKYITKVDRQCQGGLYIGTVTYTCEVCGASYVENVYDATAQSSFTSLEDAQAYHGSGTLKESFTKPATCTSSGYTYYVCSGCNAAVLVLLDAIDHVDADGKLANYKEPSCTATGQTGAYRCKTCKTYYIIDKEGKQINVESKNGLALNKCSASLEHITASTCANKEHWACNKCGKTYADENAIQPVEVKLDHDWNYIAAGTKATCNIDGYATIRHCSVCNQYEVYQETILGKISYLNGVCAFGDLTEIIGSDALEDFFNTPYERLSHSDLDGESLIKDLDGHNHDDSDCEDCADVEYEHHICTLCGYEYLDNYMSATGGHVNKNGEILTNECSNYNVKDRYCVICDADIRIKHNIDEDHIIKVPSTCVTEGYYYEYCENEGCSYRWVDPESTLALDPKNHANLSDESVLSNYAITGYTYRECLDCGKVLADKKELPVENAGVEIILSSDINRLCVGSTVRVTVSLDSLKGVDVWGFNFNLYYDPAVAEYVGYEYVSENFTVAHGVTDQTATREIKKNEEVITETYSTGVLRIAANASGNVAIKGSQNIVVLEFKIVGEPKSEDGKSAVEFSVGKNLVNSTSEKPVVSVVNERGRAIACLYNGYQDLGVEFIPFLDVNGDGIGSNNLNMGDILALYELVIFDEYALVADTNFDGIVNLIDLTNAYDILVGKATVEEFLGLGANIN